MSTIKVLFVCIHNSARSQMAEAFLKRTGVKSFEVFSAGIEAGVLNPVVVEVMKETGIDISGNQTKNVSEFIERGEVFDYVITVCDETSAERCPYFPGKVQRLHWNFRDPSGFMGTHEDRLGETRVVRDEIRAKVEAWAVSIMKNKNID
jgi:arsenate reductase (thioredoxin)